ncbi:unnamed protein product [Medioppia subpectinata]|uniref:Neurotransmitter-gated ion-channel ligand-binding domain-containing protein n=1 Tax=Medioppia subpectinata TaxID=1979941 RepID=A0A7R9L8P4_9ACAR|nr:unnamed protein product [Medioppia subpectinata]CAG2116278.1 unnamed protein product [Medioppia subpectinata]
MVKHPFIGIIISTADAIKRLRKDLFTNRGYDPMIIPVKNWSHTLNVAVTFNLDDQHLTWKPEDYGGIGAIRVKPEEVFKPDIMLYNAADVLSMKDNLIQTNVLLYSNGVVFWVPPILLKSFCQLDLTDWPYDQQNCWLKFGSWTHDGLAINISADSKISLSDYWTSQEWDVLDTRTERKDMYYDCCPEPYPDVTFFLRLKRKTSLYHYTVFIPVTTAFGFGTDTIPYAVRYISRIILTIGLTLVWTTIAHNVQNLNIQLPDAMRRVTATTQWLVVYSGNENSDTNGLISDDNVNNNPKDKSLEILILLIDKLMFGIFFILF